MEQEKERELERVMSEKEKMKEELKEKMREELTMQKGSLFDRMSADKVESLTPSLSSPL